VKLSTTTLLPALAVLMQFDVTPLKEVTLAAIAVVAQNSSKTKAETNTAKRG
jgi:hypothetical protein